MLSTIVGVLSTAFIGLLGWAVQLHTRVASLEAKDGALRELLESKFAEINRRLERIENAVHERR